MHLYCHHAVALWQLFNSSSRKCCFHFVCQTFNWRLGKRWMVMTPSRSRPLKRARGQERLCDGGLTISHWIKNARITPLQRGTQVWFEFPAEIPVAREISMKFFLETAEIKKIFRRILLFVYMSTKIINLFLNKQDILKIRDGHQFLHHFPPD